MKKTLVFMMLLGIITLLGCEGDPGPQGPRGVNGQDGLLSEVLELQNVSFGFQRDRGYTIYQVFNTPIYDSDSILMYRLSDVIDSSTPVWQLIPRTLYLPEGELDYDYDFSKNDFTIYAGGNYDLFITPFYIQNQTFRIVIIPGYFSRKVTKKVDFEDYNAVIKAFLIDDSRVEILN